MTNNLRYKGNQSTNAVNLGRNASPYIWANCPWDGIKSGAVDGVTFFDDFDTPGFTTPTTDGAFPPFYHAFTSTGGTLVPTPPAAFGTLVLGSDGDNEGASLQTNGTPFTISLTSGKLWFEARVKVDTIANTKYDAFIGFMEQVTLTAIVPITATAGTGLLPGVADQNLVGWYRPGQLGADWAAIYKANGVTAVCVLDAAFVPVADTYCKLGMYFDGVSTLTFYVNGIPVATKTIPSALGTDFPNDVTLGFTAGVTNAAVVTSLFTIDWVRMAQVSTNP